MGLALLLGCSSGDSAAPTEEDDDEAQGSDAGARDGGDAGPTDAGMRPEDSDSPRDAAADTGATAADTGMAPADAGAQDPADPDAAITPNDPATPPGCNLSGLWAARLTTESIALLVPQYANNWYYYELTQRGGELEIKRHMDCGIEVRGSVTVVLAAETTRALLERNQQAGRRKGVVTAADDGSCALEMDQFWSVRGVDEQKYAPDPRTRAATVADLQRENPMPTAEMPDQAEDWDGDGEPGIAWHVTGIVAGVRHTAQRDWTRFFTAPGFTIPAGEDFTQDVAIRAEFGNEEVVFVADLGLNQLSQPNASAPHKLTLRFLGRTPDDPRAAAVLGSDDFATCANVRAALPALAGLQ